MRLAYLTPYTRCNCPKHKSDKGIGIVPDVEVNLRPADFKAGKDTVLQRAIEIAEEEIKAAKSTN